MKRERLRASCMQVAACLVASILATACTGLLGDFAIDPTDGGPGGEIAPDDAGDGRDATVPGADAGPDAHLKPDATPTDGGGDACVTLPDFCTNRCGPSVDNCNRAINCGGCDGGATCTSGACGCVPEPTTKTCAGKACGPATNNCGQTVQCPSTCGAATPCGVGGAGPNACCVTDNATPCNSLACGPTTNNCGQPITCPNTCGVATPCGVGGAGKNQCCVPTTSCSSVACGTVTNNCGQTLTCPSTCASTTSDGCTGGACTCNGASACTGALRCCGALGCKDLATDTANCGTCGRTCQPTFSCSGGNCVCPFTLCGTTCTTLSDNNNCGSCGNKCVSPDRCKPIGTSYGCL